MKGQWGKLVGYMLVAAIVSAVLVALPMVFGGTGWLPEEVSSESSMIDELFWGLMILSIVIFGIVGGLVAYAMVHFRAAPGDLSDGEHIHGNFRLEATWILLPAIIVVVIGVISYAVLRDEEVGLYNKSAAKDPGAATMQVDVRGFSFGWAFRYVNMATGKPIGDFGTLPSSELILPLNQVVKFNVMSCSGKEHLGRIRAETIRELANPGTEFAEIEPGLCERYWDSTTKEEQEAARADAKEYFEVKAALQDGKKITADQQKFWDAQPTFHGDVQTSDVNHAFWVPETRLKVDAVSGLRTYVQWQPNKLTGPDDKFQVVCAELCGAGHNGMRTDMCVVSQGAFDWFLGLKADDRSNATCVNLRLLNCLSGVSDYGKTVDAIAEVTAKDPGASCDDVEERVA